MKLFSSIICTTLFVITLSAQKSDEVLATATGVTFTTSSLSENVRKNYLGRDAAVAAERTRLLADFSRQVLLETDAKARGTTGDALITAELKSVLPPSDAEVKAVYDANRTAFGTNTIEQVRPQIVGFLRNGAEQRALSSLAERLKVKHQYAAGKDINAPDLKPADVVFTVAAKGVTTGEFNERYKAQLYDLTAAIVTQASYDLENTIFNTLLEQEARARSVEIGDLIATEITNKLREFSEQERFALQEALRLKLFQKSSVKILIKEPDPVAHNVSADDDPATGKADAPVTVIMFSDFQCSACAATHPVLKRAISGYTDKVRFVVRDFPLESVHENAFRSALAANAARAQGKFFEYIEVLYRNQDTLDEASLKRFAVELGLNTKQFELDLTSEKAAAEVRKDMADGDRYAVRSTPTIFVNGVKAQRLSEAGFRAMIGRSLAASK